jgi:peptidoglycan/xylan/chitin deacetylase (PgdA/CDA1 family)
MRYSIRNILAYFVSRLLILSGPLKNLKKKVFNGEIILSIYCHNPSKLLFENCICWLQKNGFRFISVDELHQISSGEKPFPRGAIILTVDDGWRNNKENIAEVANKYEIPVTIFVSTEPVETGNAFWWSYISKGNETGIIKAQVGELKKVPNDDRLKLVELAKVNMKLDREALTREELSGISETKFVSIGSHTVTHPILTKCSDDKALFEIFESRKILENWLNREIVHFAYPNGTYSQREMEILKICGYQMAFTTNPKYITRQNITQAYSIPRVDILETVSFSENICRMTGLWFKKKELIRLIPIHFFKLMFFVS